MNAADGAAPAVIDRDDSLGGALDDVRHRGREREQ